MYSGMFDQSKPLPNGEMFEQAEGVFWMAFYCVVMLDIALELASLNSHYENVASKFLEHFVAITEAMEKVGGKADNGLWNEEDGFYYNHIRLGGRQVHPSLASP